MRVVQVLLIRLAQVREQVITEMSIMAVLALVVRATQRLVMQLLVQLVEL
jgi:hypothetical protein